MSLLLEGATVRRGGKTILRDADVLARPGSFTALCGPNGAGKTTALSVMSGSILPDQGRALLDGLTVAKMKPAQMARRRAVLPQSSALTFPFRVHEVVAMGRTPHEGRTTPQEDAEIVLAAMERTDVVRFAERNYLTLSGGERQRVQIARALTQIWQEPQDGATRWLLLDEPTAALDLKYQLRTIRMLKSLAGEGWGIVAVLHDLALVKDQADHVVLFQDAAVAAAGPPPEIMTPDTIRRVFDLDEAIVL